MNTPLIDDKSDPEPPADPRDAEIAHLRAIANWAAGRALDFGDVYGHEKVLALLGGIEDV